MLDLSQPVPMYIIISSIIFIFIVIGISLLIVKYYKKKFILNLNEEKIVEEKLEKII